MPYRLALLLPAALLGACAQQPAAAPPRPPVAAPQPSPQAEAPVAARIDAEASDAQALLVASAMSYLGKTAARFDAASMEVEVVEYDPAALLDEAFADPEFCALVAAADIEPHDGVLDAAEASQLEQAVLARL